MIDNTAKGARGLFNRRAALLYNAEKDVTDALPRLPKTLDEAISLAKGSTIVEKYLPAEILEAFIKSKNKSE